MTTRNTPDYTVNISASPGEDSVDFGYDAHFFNRAIISLSEFFLFNNARVLFGHDWREDGVMRAVADAAEKAATSRVFNSPKEAADRMINIVPEKKENISSLAKDAEDSSGGIMKVFSLEKKKEIYDLFGISGSTHNMDVRSEELFKSTPLKLIYLRKVLTEVLNPGIRICLGGKTSGYTGFLPGIVEEALFALKYGKPLYIVGGFGGAAHLVAQFLLSENPPEEPKKEHTIQIPPNSTSSANILNDLIDSDFLSRSDDRQSLKLKVPMTDLFSEYRTKNTLFQNGLTKKENMKLAESTDLEEIKYLIHLGYKKVKNDKK